MNPLLILLVVFGIGLVIFVHELGHFLAARICGVRVEVFSLGLGPRLFGWKRGSTVYQVALLPIGGYCRMAGEERRAEGLAPEPDELPAQSVGARFFIYSGGVLMNLLFGLVVFPILFQVGVPFLSPILGQSVPGTPAWHARLEPGSEVLEVNGNWVLDFPHIASEVALGNPERTELLLRAPGGDELRVELTPEYNAGYGAPFIGVQPALDRDAAGHAGIDVAPDTPAAEAGLSSDDRLVAVLEGAPGLPLLEQISAHLVAADPLALRVRGPSGERDVTITPRPSDQMAPPRVGVRPVQDEVLDLRSGPAVDLLGLARGDRLLSAQGRPILRPGDLQRALIEGQGPLRVEVLRGSRRLVLEAPPLPPAEALALAADVHVGASLEETRVCVNPGEPAHRAGVRDGDRIARIDGTETESWNDLVGLVARATQRGGPALLSVEREAAVAGQGSTFLDLPVTPEEQPAMVYGLSLRRAEYVYRSENLGEALRVGTYCSWKFLQDGWLTLKSIVLGQVSSENIGGIISIGAISYTLAESGWEKLFFFLCILSINLAFLNVLPIPVLDGGHLFFLIVEKLKGSPVSERVLGYSQMVGVVLILSLMVYVTYNDLVRWVLDP